MAAVVPNLTLSATRRKLVALGISTTADEIGAIKARSDFQQFRIALADAHANSQSHALVADVIAEVRGLTKDSLFNSRPTAPQPRPSRNDLPEFVPSFRSRVPVVIPSMPRRARSGVVRHGEPSPHVPTVVRPSGVEFHVYGKSAALKISAGASRSGEPVAFVSAAAASATRAYDWATKTTLMLNLREIAIALSVLTAEQPWAKLERNAPDGKWMQILHQGANLFIQVGQGKSIHAVPVGPADAFRLATLLTTQLRLGKPAYVCSDVVELVRMVLTPMLNASTGRKT